MTPQEMVNHQNTYERPGIPRWILGAILGFALVASFFLGASSLCSHSGGEIVLGSYECKELEVVGLCEIDGQKYVLPPDSQAQIMNVTGGDHD